MKQNNKWSFKECMERAEFAAKEAEEAAFTLEMWMMAWRKRQEESRACVNKNPAAPG